MRRTLAVGGVIRQDPFDLLVLGLKHHRTEHVAAEGACTAGKISSKDFGRTEQFAPELFGGPTGRKITRQGNADDYRGNGWSKKFGAQAEFHGASSGDGTIVKTQILRKRW
ncbi:MAG: hypothetical protein P4L39_09735 [Humidesulfovibrio sp.]|nr:hypothetical protein [Humidesulfovibrio sp.]